MKRVLLVEDDGDLRAVLTERLSAAGYTVDEAGHGLEALEKLGQAPPPDLIVLDLMLPVMDGWQFRAEQRQAPNLAGTPVVVITGNESAKAAALDAQLYLRKPFQFEQLRSGIDRILSDAESARMRERLAHTSRVESLGTMAAGLSHEINNPLAAILSSLQLLQRRAAAEPALSDTEQVISAAIEAGVRIARLVKDVSTFARVPSAPSTSLDLSPCLDSALSVLSHELRARDVRVVRDQAPTPLVHASPALLAQVFVNLLTNAVQAFDEGQGVASQREVRIRAYTDSAGRAVVEISDTGSGMSQEVIHRIFEPFFTTKPIGAGTGLGLAICHGIVTALGGEIDVESVVGRGSTFRVRLPAASNP